MRCIFWSLWTAMYYSDRCLAHKVTVMFSPAIHHLLSHSNLDRSEFFAYKLYKSDHINRYQDSMRPFFWSLSTNDLKLNFLTIRLNIPNNQIKIWKRLENTLIKATMTCCEILSPSLCNLDLSHMPYIICVYFINAKK